MKNHTPPKLFLFSVAGLLAIVGCFVYLYWHGGRHAVNTAAIPAPKTAVGANPGLKNATVVAYPVASVHAERDDDRKNDEDEEQEKKKKKHGFIGEDKDEDPDEKGGFNKRALIEGAFKLEFKKTRDLTTNTVPKYRLVAAAAYADKLQARNAASGAGTQGSLGTQGALGGFAWVERGPNNIGGRTRAILPDLNDATGNTVWAGSISGGLWKTTNALTVAPGNPLWQPVNNFFHNLAISSIAQNSTNTKLIYFGTGEGWYNGDAVAGDGIWKSADDGATWNQLSSTEDTVTNYTFGYVQKVLDYTVAGTEYLFACTLYGGVQLSTNGGATWKESLGTDEDSTVPVKSAADIERGADGALYASLGIGEQGGIYKSQDNGTTWVPLGNGLPTSGYQRIVLGCAPSDSLRVYALLQDANTSSCMGVYRSDSAGRVWYPVTNPTIYGGDNFAGDQAWYSLVIGVDPNNANRIIVGGLDLTASKDGGNTWTTISQWYGGGGYQYVHADHHAIVFAPRSSNIIYFGNDGGMFATTTGNATTPTINQIDSSYNVTQFYHAAIHPAPGQPYLIAGAQDNGNIQFVVAGINAGYNFTGGDGAFEHIDDDNPNVQIASYVYGNYYISTDGFNLTDTSIAVNNGGTGQFINPTDYDSRDKIMYGADNPGAYHEIFNVGTKDNTSVTTIPAFTHNGNPGQVEAVRVSPNKRHRVFFGLDNATLFMVDNANAAKPTVTEIDNGAFPFVDSLYLPYLSCITVEPGNDNHLLVCFSNFGLKGQSIFETKNGGKTWGSITGNLPDMPIRSICFKPYSNTAAIIGTDLGVWSTDTLQGAATVWGESNTGLARVSTDWVEYRKSDGTLFAATHGRGLFTSTSFVKPVISYVKSDTTVTTTAATNSTSDCRKYSDIVIPVQLSSAPSAGAVVKLTVSSSSLVQGIDYDLITTGNITFSTPGFQYVTVRVYNTAKALANDTLSVGLTLVNGSATNAIVTPFPDFNAYTIFVNSVQPVTLPVQTAVDTLTASQFVGPNRTAYFYDGTPAKLLVASVKNNSATSLGCVTLEVDRAGGSANVPFTNNDSANYLASKTIRLVPANKAATGLNYTLTLYYTNAEVATWAAGSGRNAAALKIIGVNNHTISAVTPSQPYTSNIFVASTKQGVYNKNNYSFTANFTSIDSVQGFGIGDTTLATLPITLLSFEGRLDKGNTILTWKTASEINNKGFDVERSNDGASFTQIGFVTGKGTTSLASNYTFTDNAVPDGVLYYRLRQVDFDGNFSYSNIVVVSNNSGPNTVSVGENPFHTQLNLAFKGSLYGVAYVNVFDMAGKKVYSTTKNVQTTMPLNIGNVSNGVYMVSVLWNGKHYLIKVVKN